jgi:hypothetical protein
LRHGIFRIVADRTLEVAERRRGWIDLSEGMRFVLVNEGP